MQKFASYFFLMIFCVQDLRGGIFSPVITRSARTHPLTAFLTRLDTLTTNDRGFSEQARKKMGNVYASIKRNDLHNRT
ncbi:MAG: hypothetical protein CL570_06475 [Alphaproteobacteria bacterium]|nr:hypothetical protein [Alphaproteobacteria bacterium]HCQ71748.1 hypothetical protein [Rhodospirillaceae bacterium]